MGNTKVNCVVVTYNRLALLKENIEALQRQTYPIEKIVIVNNNSTDDTAQYLRKYENNPLFHIVNLPENLGGAGGFNRGIKQAVVLGCDWVWVMDDDTIPTATALENLVKYRDVTPKVGFIGSRVLWTDGSVHKMNMPGLVLYAGKTPFNMLLNKGVIFVGAMSFVSLLVSSDAIKAVGLPISEFFIWCDDAEFTSRITSAGYAGLYADSSIVCHKTPDNYDVDILTASKSSAWKFYHERKNKMYMLRRVKRTYVQFVLSLMGKLFKELKQVNKRKSDKMVFAKMVVKAYWRGLSFNPKIEYIDNK